MGFWWISLVPVLTLCRSQYLYLPSIGAFWVIGVIVRNGKHETRSSTGDIARVILSGALILGLLFHFNYKQQHWNHSGWVASAVKDVIQTIHPTLPANSRVVLLNPPQNNNLKMGVFQNGFAEAVRNWYNDDSLDGIRVRHPENFTDIRPDTDIVFDCNGAEIRDVTDIWSKQSEITVVIPHTSEVILNNDRRYHRLDFDPVESDSLAMFTQLSHGCDLAQGATVAEITLFFSDDSQQVVTLDAGRDTAEWAIDRDDLKNKCSHLRASVAASTIKGDAPEPPTYSHLYKASWNFGEVKQLLGLNIRLLLGKDGQSGTRPELVIRGVNCLRRNN